MVLMKKILVRIHKVQDKLIIKFSLESCMNIKNFFKDTVRREVYATHINIKNN